MTDSQGYTSIMNIPELDELACSKAKDLFIGYREKEVIKAGTFEDNVWKLTDQYAYYTFNFNISFISDNYYKLFGFSSEEFEKYLKIYVLYKMGDLVLNSLRTIILHTKYVLQTNISDLSNINQKCEITGIFNIIEFFLLLPSDYLDEKEHILELLEYAAAEQYSNKRSESRELASFDSYFKFNDILMNFWQNADEEEKLFYFPVYLWWKLSAIVPMRPREFVLTPRNCLNCINNVNYMTIKKNNLKGSKKKVSYNVHEDYREYTFSIPESMAETIRWYITKTKDFDKNELESLFIADTHYKKWGRCRPYTSRYFTYTNLSTSLRYFYQQIVVGRFGYKVNFDRSVAYLPDKEIHYIYLGDTRHLALINIIYEGGAPLAAMILAGQDDADVSANYFANITKLVECKVFREYKKLTNDQKYSINKSYVNYFKTGNYVSLDKNDRCYSSSVSKGDFSDCYKVSGPTGEIGYCPNCSYFRSAGTSFFDSKEKYISQIKTECDALARIVKAVRNEKGKSEDIIQAVLRLQTSDYSYRHYLLETMKGEHYAKTEKNIY